MNNINALIERLFDWRSIASSREFLNRGCKVFCVQAIIALP